MSLLRSLAQMRPALASSSPARRGLWSTSRTALALRTRPSALTSGAATPLRALSTSKVGADDSHSDFAPERKDAGDNAELVAFLDQAIKEHPILLFMKGVPEAPRCGFSAQVVRVLKEHGADFSSADVLASDEIREGIKAFSKWPTIPQLYVNGEFVGGCDIVTEMHESGDLKELLASAKKMDTTNTKE